jgi:predicted DNA-binding transcriptional regulator AlpA
MNTPTLERLLTAEEAAQLLEVSKARLYRMTGTGLLRSVPHGKAGMRFLELELASYRYHQARQGTQLRLANAARRRREETHQVATLPEETLPAPRAAAYLGMKLDTLYWRARHGQIPFLPAPGQRGKRFRVSDLDAWRAGQSAEAPPVEEQDTAGNADDR